MDFSSHLLHTNPTPILHMSKDAFPPYLLLARHADLVAEHMMDVAVFSITYVSVLASVYVWSYMWVSGHMSTTAMALVLVAGFLTMVASHVVLAVGRRHRSRAWMGAALPPCDTV